MITPHCTPTVHMTIYTFFRIKTAGEKKGRGGGAEGFSAVLKMNENEKEGGGGCDEEGRQRWVGVHCYSRGSG